MFLSDSLSLAQQQARLFQPTAGTRFGPCWMVTMTSTTMIGSMAAPTVICLHVGANTPLVGDDIAKVHTWQAIPWSLVGPSTRWTSTGDRHSLSPMSIPAREHAARVSTVLGLGKRQVARFLGVSRMTLYDWIKGEIEPQGRNAERLAAVGHLVTEICRDTERPLYHRFVEAPLEGETESILDLLQGEQWDEPRLRVLLKRARDLTSERDQRLGIGKHDAESGRPDQGTILTDNLISLGLG